jgi:GNAT superfamily N-acetyltransferase
MEHAIAKAWEKGCRLVQLTINKQRTEARRFYEKLGFAFTHEGAKMMLETNLPNQPDADGAQ